MSSAAPVCARGAGTRIETPEGLWSAHRSGGGRPNAHFSRLLKIWWMTGAIPLPSSLISLSNLNFSNTNISHWQESDFSQRASTFLSTPFIVPQWIYCPYQKSHFYLKYSFWSLSRPSSSYLVKKKWRNGFSTSLSQLLPQECNKLNSDPNSEADKHRHLVFWFGICRELRSGWFWLNVMQPGMGPIISGPGLKAQGSVDLLLLGQNPEWKQGLLLQTWVQTWQLFYCL